MNVRIGAAVTGKNGKLGELHRLVIDPQTDRVTDLVVKHGRILGRERLVPLEHVLRAEGDEVQVDLDEDGFGRMEAFVQGRYQTPTGPSSLAGIDRGALLVDTYGGGAGGAMLGGGPAGPRLPEHEQATTEDQRLPAVERGMRVVDVDGELVGHVADVSAVAETGEILRLGVRIGGIAGLLAFEAEIPLGWVGEIGDEGVSLNVTKSEVEALMDR